MKDEVLYEFEVVENIGKKYSEVCFGKPGTKHEMTEDGFTGKDGVQWQCYKTIDALNKRVSGMSYETKFKLVETYKIDLCKIIGVEELQEFKCDSIKCRVKENHIEAWSKLSNKWLPSVMELNHLVDIMNNNRFEILPKFERLEIGEWNDGYLRAWYENGYNWISVNYEHRICVSKTSAFSKEGAIYTYLNQEVSHILAKVIKKEYSLVKHFESGNE